MIFKVKVEWPWRYRSRSKVITCDTPSHASDHLYQIWKESIQNCRCYRADTIFKVKAEWPWKYRSVSKVITCDTPSDANDDLCQIWKECKQNCRFHAAQLLMLVIICTKYGKNPSRTVDGTEWTLFSRSRPNDLQDIGQSQRSLYETHLLILVIICAKYGKNPSRTVDFFSRLRPKHLKNLPKFQISRFW